MKSVAWTLAIVCAGSLPVGWVRGDTQANLNFYRTSGAVRTTVRRALSRSSGGDGERTAAWARVLKRRPRLSRPGPVTRSREAGLRLLSSADEPDRMILVCTSDTVDEVRAVLAVLDEINESRVAPQPPVRLHLITSSNDVLKHVPIERTNMTGLVEVNPLYHTCDVWVRDFGAWGCSPKRGVPAEVMAIDTRRGGSPAGLPQTLARVASGRCVVPSGLTEGFCGNFGGNVSVTPHDVAVVGNTVEESLLAFLERSGYRERVAVVDTDWLHVGHVDEMMSFLPLPGRSGHWAIICASPRLAVKLFSQVSVERLDGELTQAVRNAFPGRQGHLLNDGERTAIEEMATSVGLLQSYLAGRSATEFEGAPSLFEFNEAAGQTIEDAVRDVMYVSRTSRAASSLPVVIPLPVLFRKTEEGACALTPNAVNLVALDDDLLVPDPLFPCLRSAIRDTLEPMGFEVHYVCTTTYHTLGGGMHCASSVLRRPRP